MTVNMMARHPDSPRRPNRRLGGPSGATHGMCAGVAAPAIRLIAVCAALALFASLGGCAAGQAVTSTGPAKDAEPPIVLVTDPAATGFIGPPAPVGPSVTPLPVGREGFMICELPTVPELWRGDFSAAVECMGREDFEGAVELLTKVLEHEPGVTAPHINIALAYLRLDKVAEAEEHLKKALELVPAHPLAGNAYGLLLRGEGRFEEAREVYQKVLERFPDYAPAHRNLGILCDLYLGDLECARVQYEAYSEVRPGDEQVTMWLADLRMRQ